MLLAKSPKSRRRRLSRTPSPAMVSERLLDVELATVGALRSLQMDLTNDPGVPLEAALRDARKTLKR